MSSRKVTMVKKNQILKHRWLPVCSHLSEDSSGSFGCCGRLGSVGRCQVKSLNCFCRRANDLSKISLPSAPGNGNGGRYLKTRCICYYPTCYLQTFLSFCFYSVFTSPVWLISHIGRVLCVPKITPTTFICNYPCQLCPTYFNFSMCWVGNS